MEYKLEWQGLTLGATQQHEEQRKQQDLHVVRYTIWLRYFYTKTPHTKLQLSHALPCDKCASKLCLMFLFQLFCLKEEESERLFTVTD